MKNVSEGMFSQFAKLFPNSQSASITTNQNIQSSLYRMVVSIWNLGQRWATITIMKGDRTIWEHKTNNLNNLKNDLLKAEHMLKSIGLNPTQVRILKKINGNTVKDLQEAVHIEALEERKSPKVQVPLRKGLKVGDVNDLGNGQIEIILPRNDLNKRKELLEPYIKDGYKMVQTIKNMNMDIMTLQELKEEFSALDEYVMDYQQRRKRGIIMKRYKNKIKMARARKARRLASTDQLKIRARRAAIKILRRKLAGKLGLMYGELSAPQKAMIDEKVHKRKNAIERIAKKILPRIRKMEVERYKRMLQSKAKQSQVKPAKSSITKPTSGKIIDSGSES